MIKKYHNHKLQTNPWHCKEELQNNHKALGRQTKESNSSFFPIEKIAKLELISSNAQKIEQIQTPKLGGLNSLYWYQIVEAQNILSSYGNFLTNAMYHHGKTILSNTLC